MKKSILTLLLTTVLALSPRADVRAQGKDDLAHHDSDVYGTLVGGFVGRFVPTPHSLNTTGTTDFAVNVKLMRNGTASGEFVCAVPSVVVLAVQVTSWTRTNAGIKLVGAEYGYDTTAGGYNECPAIVTIRPGGPHTGGFDFTDCVFGPDQYDTEVLQVGWIELRR